VSAKIDPGGWTFTWLHAPPPEAPPAA
jgi:hypothetical protein